MKQVEVFLAYPFRAHEGKMGQITGDVNRSLSQHAGAEVSWLLAGGGDIHTYLIAVVSWEEPAAEREITPE